MSSPVLAHRCVEHVDLPPVNAAGKTIVHYPAEGVPTYRALDAMKGECGACLAEEVETIWREYLNTLDIVADLLRAHAELRARTTSNLILPPGV